MTNIFAYFVIAVIVMDGLSALGLGVGLLLNASMGARWPFMLAVFNVVAWAASLLSEDADPDLVNESDLGALDAGAGF